METEAHPPVIVAFVDDLMDRSRISAAVPEVRFARAPEAAAGATTVVVDLARHARLVAAIRVASGEARIVAFGPHVDDRTLAAARGAGADAVMARSRFFRDIPVALHDIGQTHD